MSISLNTPLLAGNYPIQSVAAPSSNKLHSAAQQFEALLVGEMLKSARESGSDGWLGSSESTGDDSAMEMAESQLANALSSGGGLGLAKVIERSMTLASVHIPQNTAETQRANSPVSSDKP